MKILAIDTATEACSAALLFDNKIESQFEICPQQHSQKLLPMVDAILQSSELSVKQLDCLAFGRGPGSFTGVRIATGIIQGLALGADLPVVGVSTLVAMAQQAIDSQNRSELTIAVAIDARMEEVYFAQFRNNNGVAELIGEEQVLAPKDAAKQVASDTKILAGTGWQAYPQLSAWIEKLGEPQILYPDAASMLNIARHAFNAGQATDVENIQPVYLRDKVTWQKLPGR